MLHHVRQEQCYNHLPAVLLAFLYYHCRKDTAFVLKKESTLCKRPEELVLTFFFRKFVSPCYRFTSLYIFNICIRHRKRPQVFVRQSAVHLNVFVTSLLSPVCAYLCCAGLMHRLMSAQ